jgi:hypothetical protein
MLLTFHCVGRLTALIMPASKFDVLNVHVTGESNSPCNIKVSLCSAHVE